MKTNLIITLIVALCVPLAADAQVYRCKTANGTWAFGDIPCPDNSPLPKQASPGKPVQPAAERMDYPRAAPVQSAAPPAQASAPASRESPRKRYVPTAKDLEELRALDRAVKEFPAKVAAACNGGDKKACLVQTCLSFDWGQGKPDAFRACASARKLTAGSFWALVDGSLALEGADMDEHLKMGVGKNTSNALHLKCFRQKAGWLEVVGSDVYASVRIDVVNGAAGPALKRTYLPQDLWGGQRVLPKFASLDLLADYLCDK